jgi:hypothetical protein
MASAGCAVLQLPAIMSEPAWKPTSHDSRSAHLDRQHQHRRRQTQILRRRLVVSLIVLALIAAGVWVVVGNGGPGPSTVARGGSSDARSKPSDLPTTTTTTTTAPPPTTTTTSPGTLPQTGTFPTTTSQLFTANMVALWNGIVTDSVQVAIPAFFPESAYVQLKTVPSARDDFTERLVADYGLDIGAAHALLGPNAASAQFVGVDVDSAYGHWINSGVCYNDVGYFEVPNSRVVYTVNGQTHSFGIASMISWRGEWYVVHLGAILRSGSGGEVDDPEDGPGNPTYSPTC